MSEELALEEVFRDRRAIHLYQGSGRACAPRVEDVGEHLLADAAFARDQDPRFGGGDQGGIADDRLHQRAAHHDVAWQRLVLAVLEGNGLRDAGGLLHGGQQLVQIDGFRQIVDRAIAHRDHCIANVGVGGDKQDGQCGVLLAGAPQGVQSGKARHAHVGNHHVEVARAQCFQRPLAGVRRHRLEALALQE